MQNFKKLSVWRKAMEASRECYAVTAGFPAAERFGLQAQMRRAAVSIPSNIAEGSGRRSSKDFVRFLRIAYGSSCELETQALLAISLEFGDEAELQKLLAAVDEVQRMLSTLIDRVTGAS
ncbi:MAG: four helix bundle protein [Acidimicrobiia bacterium]|nr:four helix bundle protein [Acidimicrobiia bacterium]